MSWTATRLIGDGTVTIRKQTTLQSDISRLKQIS